MLNTEHSQNYLVKVTLLRDEADKLEERANQVTSLGMTTLLSIDDYDIIISPKENPDLLTAFVYQKECTKVSIW